MAGISIKAPKGPKVSVPSENNPNLGRNDPARRVSRAPRTPAINTRDYGKVNAQINPSQPAAPGSIQQTGFGSTGLPQ